MRKFIMTCWLLVILLSPLLNVFSGLVHATPTHGKVPHDAKKLTFHHACATPPAGVWWQATCFSIISQVAAPSPAGPLATAPGASPPYKPANLHKAYNLPTTAPSGQTIGIVDANDDPQAESDMATYRSTFGIPACTTANGCFRKVDQNGGGNYPAGDTGWAEEISLDLDMVSAICYNCHILLVEASSSSLNDLGAAVNTAVRLGATVVSNSYGSNGEISNESAMCNAYYNHPGVALTVSSGDSGLGVVFPTVCPHVVSVGGTTLYSDGNEVDWNSNNGGAGGGCSTQIAKPSWENSSVTSCSQRAVADVSAVADPNTGVYIYDSYGVNGWFQIGGTSASSPIIAATYALAGGVKSNTEAASLPWKQPTSGGGGGGCGAGMATANCLNQVGTTTYSYQGGLGTPNGLKCF